MIVISPSMVNLICDFQDAAFLDRVDIKQFIPKPPSRVIYEIYKSCLEDLSRCGIIEGKAFDVIQTVPDDVCAPLEYIEQSADVLLLPGYDEMLLRYQMFPDSIPKQLVDAASASQVSLAAESPESPEIISLCFTIRD